MEECKSINWNDMSKLGLIHRINREILHPLGLAICRNLDGTSDKILVAPDGFFQYDTDTQPVTDEIVLERLTEIMESKNEV